MKTLKFLIVSAIALMALAGCDDTDELVDDTPVYDDTYYAANATISSSDSNFTKTDSGGEVHFKFNGGEVKVLVSCGTEWVVRNSNPDCFSAYMEDSYYVTITAGVNLVEEEQTSTVTLVTAEMNIAFASITVTQNAYGVPEITVETNEWKVPAVGELATSIEVESSVEWTFENGAEWLTIEKTITGISLVATENEEYEERTANVVLTCTDGYNSDYETVRVIQDGLAYLTLGEKEVSFPQFENTTSVAVESNFDWECAYDADWIITEKDGDGSITITCTTNETGMERSCVITVTAGDGAVNVVEAEIAVTQAAHTLTVDATEWHAPAVGELTTEIGVDGSDDWSVAVEADWLTAEKTEDGILLTAKENTETEERTTEVVVSCNDGSNTDFETITVTQDGAAYITLSREEMLLMSYECSATVTFDSNFDIQSYDGSDSWVSVSYYGGILTVSAKANEGDKRTATVTITAGDGKENFAEAQLTVSQANDTDMILTYTITSPNTMIQLPVYRYNNALDCTVDWDDGTEPQHITSSQPDHTFAVEGEYNVIISGTVPKLSCWEISQNVTSLTAVRQWGKTGLTNMEYAFYYCTNLVSLPEYTGDAFENVTSFKWAFSSCQSLEAIPAGLFGNCPAATDFSLCFNMCHSIQTIAADAFNCPKGENFHALFYNCNNLTEIPAGLFDNCPEATNFTHTFYMTGVRGIPAGLFKNNTKAERFCGTFYGSVNIREIPAGLFDNCPEVTDFSFTFYNTSVKEIPAGLFKNNTKVETFDAVFYECSNITEIPLGLFDNCPAVTDFSFTFYDTSVKEIPSGLFKNNTKVETFYAVFHLCSSLTAVPEGLFNNCPEVTNFSFCFSGCTSLRSIPESLFAGNPEVTDFQSAFYSTRIPSIPSGILSNNKKVVNFWGTFSYCTSITSGESPYDLINGEKVHLYERENHPDIYTTPEKYANCFISSTGLDDYSSIPPSWKGEDGSSNSVSVRTVSNDGFTSRTSCAIKESGATRY